MKQSLILLILTVLALSCQPKETSLQPFDPIRVEADKQAALAKTMADNWQLDWPTFDDSKLDRQLPYSPLAVPIRPRLTYAERLSYRYDSLGRLLEGSINFIGTNIASTRQVYHYDQQGLQEVAFYWGSYPGLPLGQVRRVTFLANQAGQVDRYFDHTSSTGGGSAYQLRFDESGHLIWSGLLNDENSLTQIKGYSRAIRDANHNVVLLRSTLETAYTTQYEYDDKPNPFYQLGGLPSFSSPNNVIKETKRDVAGNVLSVREYSYDYRADGYPIRKRWGTEVVDYVYEN